MVDARAAAEREFRAQPFSNDPPYLFFIANHASDVPTALWHLRWMEEEAAAHLAEMWAEARAMGVA